MRKMMMAFAVAIYGGCAEAHPPGTDIVIPMDMSGIRPAVEFSISGREPELAVFDTGSMFNFVNIELARAIGLPDQGEPTAPFAQGGAFATTIEEARIGDVRVRAIEAMATPWNILPDRIAILSPNIFSGSLVTLNFAAGELWIRQKPAAEPGGERYEYGPAPMVMPRIPIGIEDQTIPALFDTGSAYTLLFPLADSERLPLSESLVEAGRVRGHRGDFPVYTSRIAGRVQVGPLGVEDPQVRFTDAVPLANVGMEYLRQMTVTLDPEERRLWVALNQPVQD